jgi:hypothetical protein
MHVAPVNLCDLRFCCQVSEKAANSTAEVEYPLSLPTPVALDRPQQRVTTGFSHSLEVLDVVQRDPEYEIFRRKGSG